MYSLCVCQLLVLHSVRMSAAITSLVHIVMCSVPCLSFSSEVLCLTLNNCFCACCQITHLLRGVLHTMSALRCSTLRH